MKLAVLIIFLMITQFAYGQNPYQDSIIAKAEAMYQSFFQQDFKTFIQFMHPKVVQLSGGKDKLIRKMQAEAKQNQADHILYKKVTIGEPGHLFEAGSELHCIVPRESLLEMDGEHHYLSGKMLAISQDTGRTWFFMEISGFDNVSIKKILPYFNDDLRLNE